MVCSSCSPLYLTLLLLLPQVENLLQARDAARPVQGVSEETRAEVNLLPNEFFTQRIMDFVLKMMDFVLKMMDFVLKMNGFCRLRKPARTCRSWTQTPRSEPSPQPQALSTTQCDL